MRSLLLCVFVSLFLSTPLRPDDRFDFDHTLRIDVYHTGNRRQESFTLDQVYLQNEWPGSRVNLVDTLNLGAYQVRVYKAGTVSLIYSRGYCTLFQEWQSTSMALENSATFHETIRIPCPRLPVDVIIYKRVKGKFSDRLFSVRIDPDSRFVNREAPRTDYHVRKIRDNGSPEHKVDLVILGDGYKSDELSLFHKHVNRYTSVLFQSEPFSKYADDFNIWAVDVISADSGIDEPRRKKWKRTPLGTSYNSLDLPRYVLAHDNKALHDIAALVPYDHIYVLVNSRRYGGGGIFHCMAVSYTGQMQEQPDWWSDYVFVHEFGHSFAGLADEYYSSRVAYESFYPQGVEPWEPNITALLQPDQLKWRHLIKENVPIPTLWKKEAFDSLMRQYTPDEQGRKLREQAYDLLKSDPRADVVGCYEGAGYVSKGLYRSFLDCIMFSKSVVPFCPVCQEAIERKIHFEIK